MKDRVYDRSQLFLSIIDVIDKKKLTGETILVKYRTEKQKLYFPNNNTSIVGYGKLLDYCSERTKVIGPLGSAAIECLYHNIPYYAYISKFDTKLNSSIYNKLFDALCVANCTEEIAYNLKNKKIYRQGYSKQDLLHQDGIYLYQMVDIIFRKQKELL